MILVKGIRVLDGGKMDLSEQEYRKYFHDGTIFSTLPYMIEVLTESLLGVCGIKYCDKSRWWYGEWEGDRRKVVTLGNPKGTMRNICWGWNYNYIPHRSHSGKLTYARTEKSFSFDMGGDFRFHIDYNIDDESDAATHKQIAMCRQYMLPRDTNDAEAAKEYISTVCKRNIPFIKEYFEKTFDDQATLAELERRQSEKPWLFQTDNSAYIKAFILAKYGRLEEAEHIISHEYYADGNCPENVLAKLREVGSYICQI